MTEPFMIDAFMELSDLYGAFDLESRRATERCLSYLLESLDVTGGLVFEQDINHALDLVVRAAAGVVSTFTGQTLSAEGLLGAALRFEVPIVGQLRCQAPATSSVEALCRQQDLEGPVLVVPIPGEERLEGGIVLCRSAVGAPFSESEQSLVQYVASALGRYLSLVRAEQQRADQLSEG